jgi:hypothetical protein
MRTDRAVWLALSAACVLAQPATHAADPANQSVGVSSADAAVASVSPVFHQLVAFTLPPHFKGVFESNNGSFYMRQAVPDNESTQKWTRMITLTGVKDLASNPSATPQEMTQTMAEHFRKNCPDTFSTEVLGAQPVDGYATYQVIASCGHQQAGAEAYSETAIILAVKGSADYYTLQWVERGKDSKRPLTLDTTYWSKQFAQLRPIRLCPIVLGEAAPYPSCAGQ